MKVLIYACMSASVAALAWSNQGYAAETAPVAAADNSTALTEVVVTTRKTKEKLQDVPLAITAVSQDQLDVGHFEGLEDVANQVPGLKFTAFLDSFNGNVTIRGLQQDNVQNAVGNVGSFLDGVYLQRGYLVDTSIGDFDRIEVVKGPQSSLYGENTFAGAINFVLKQPTDDFHVDGTASAGNAGLGEGKFGASGPIIKGLLDFRVFVAQSDYNGTWRNNYPGATGDNKYLGGHTWKNYSGSLKFTPTEKLTITAEYYNLHREQAIAPYYTIDGDSALDHLNCGRPTASGGYSLWCGNLPTNVSAFRTGLGDPPPGLVAQPQPETSTYTRMWKISANYKINNDFLFSYNYGNVYGSSLEQASFSTDAYNPDPPAPFGISAQREGGLITYDSHEVRLSYTGDFPIKGEVGYFHSDANDHLVFGLLFVQSGAPYLSQTSNATSLAYNGFSIPFDNLDTAYATDAPFGRLSYSFLQDKATISAEVRETKTTITTNDLLAGNEPPLKATYSDITPRFTAQYKLAPDDLLYVSAARGAKAGGFNGYVSGSLTLLPSQQAFGEETNWTYEAGWKASLLHKTLTVDADVFYINWTNKQQAVVPANYVNVVNSQSAGVVPTIYENIGNAYSYGFEMTTQWHPIRRLALDWSLSLQNPRFAAGAVEASFIGNCDNIACKANGGVAGNEINLVSQFTTDFGATYSGTLTPALDYQVGFNESYRGPEFADDTNTASLAGFWLTNIHGELIHGNVKVSLWAKNLFDTTYLSSTFSVPSIYQYNANFGERRTFGITGSFKY